MKPASTSPFVVSAIGFLGAGTIILWHEVVRGPTTAARRWGREAVERAYPEERHK
jgi:uncharacterized membrane protein YhiD involved in acid resistance